MHHLELLPRRSLDEFADAREFSGILGLDHEPDSCRFG